MMMVRKGRFVWLVVVGTHRHRKSAVGSSLGRPSISKIHFVMMYRSCPNSLNGWKHMLLVFGGCCQHKFELTVLLAFYGNLLYRLYLRELASQC